MCWGGVCGGVVMCRYDELGLSGSSNFVFTERGFCTGTAANSARISGRFFGDEGSRFFSNWNTLGGVLYADAPNPKFEAVLASVGLSSITEDTECLGSGS